MPAWARAFPDGIKIRKYTAIALLALWGEYLNHETCHTWADAWLHPPIIRILVMHMKTVQLQALVTIVEMPEFGSRDSGLSFSF